MLSWDDFEDSAQAAVPATTTQAQANAFLDGLDVVAGLQDLEMGAARINAADKRMINSRCDSNQVVPFACEWAWQKYLDGSANHWMPQEINMTADIALWKSKDGLTADERTIVMRSLGFFSTADSIVANNIVLAIYRHITMPECRQYLLRQAFEEAIHCYADGTEILTERGFVDFRDLPECVRVAQYHENGKISFVLPDEILHDRYSGKMFEFKNQTGSYHKIVTPDHRCVVIDPRDNNKVKIKLAKNLSPHNYNLPVAGILFNAGASAFSDEDRFFVAYQADGCILNKQTIDKGKISGLIAIGFNFAKQRKIERLLELCDRLGLRHKVKQLSGTNKNQTSITVWIPSDWAVSKNFAWINYALIDHQWAKQFIKELAHWDGCTRDHGEIVYTNTNKDAINHVQAIAHVAGYRTGMYKCDAHGTRKDVWQVYIYSTRTHASGRSVVRSEIDYDGYVHCVGVPTGMIITRYNGAIVVSGNTHAYQYCVESLGMDSGEVFNMYREIPSIAKKSAWLLARTRDIADPAFNTATPERAKVFLLNLIAYCCVGEGLFFYCGFAQILSMGRRNKMGGVAEQFQYILRDESMHLNFGIDMINQIKIENPELWDADAQAMARQIIVEGVTLETEYARDTMPRGILGMNAESMAEYLQFIGDRRLAQLGLSIEYGAQNPFGWMSEMMDLRKEKNFFETRVTDYQVGGALSW